MHEPLARVYGSTLVVRPPVPATVNKAGANYKSEVTHLVYSPRRAYDEWLAICEGILAFGGDAIFDFEAEDAPFLDAGPLALAPDGAIHPAGSTTRLGHIDEVQTGRVFAANGPWVIAEEKSLRVLLPNMLSHRTRETAYYERLLGSVSEATHRTLAVEPNPHRWEGMADVAVVGSKVVFTYTVPGRYDARTTPKTMRSSREGVEHAARFAGVGAESAVFAELVYPHFHGDTVHFGARPSARGPVLVHYAGGLVDGESPRVAGALGPANIVPIGRDDAVERYAGNSRQVAGGVLVPDGVSAEFVQAIEGLGLPTRKVPLFELFGKAGGGPACATLYLPSNLDLPAGHPKRYSVRRDEAQQRRARIAETLTVDPGFFEGRARG